MPQEIQPIQNATEGEIILYQPNENINLEVRLKDETVWLTTAQMAQLFNREDSNIRRHIIKIFNDGELQKDNNVHFLHVNGVKKPVPYYNLDVIISVGYRVHSPQGIAFRQWATRIIKHYLLQGYNVNRQLIALQERVDERITRIEDTQARQQQQLDFFIRTSTPPAEMVFFEGDFYTARAALEALVKTATTRIILIDGYVSSLTLSILDVRQTGVEAIIYTVGVGPGMTNLMQEHDRLFPNAHIDIRKWRNESHDRWLIIDDTLYHCGHSHNANGGHKISAITRMQMHPDIILSQM